MAVGARRRAGCHPDLLYLSKTPPTKPQCSVRSGPAAQNCRGPQGTVAPDLQFPKGLRKVHMSLAREWATASSRSSCMHTAAVPNRLSPMTSTEYYPATGVLYCSSSSETTRSRPVHSYHTSAPNLQFANCIRHRCTQPSKSHHTKKRLKKPNRTSRYTPISFSNLRYRLFWSVEDTGAASSRTLCSGLAVLWAGVCTWSCVRGVCCASGITFGPMPMVV